MKLIIILLLALFTLPAISQPEPAPRAIAKFCGNFVVPIEQQAKLQKQIYAMGCQEAVFIKVDDDHVLGYGIIIYVGE